MCVAVPPRRANATVVVARTGAVATSGPFTAGDIVIRADSGASVVAEDAWTYLDGGDIHTIAPSSGTTGTIITITGVGLAGGASVRSVTIGAVEATRILSANESTVIAEVGEDNATTVTVVDVAITNSVGAVVTRNDGFTFLPRPIVTSITPQQGQVGTYVTISGSNLLMGSSGTYYSYISKKGFLRFPSCLALARQTISLYYRMKHGVKNALCTIVVLLRGLSFECLSYV